MYFIATQIGIAVTCITGVFVIISLIPIFIEDTSIPTVTRIRLSKSSNYTQALQVFKLTRSPNSTLNTTKSVIQERGIATIDVQTGFSFERDDILKILEKGMNITVEEERQIEDFKEMIRERIESFLLKKILRAKRSISFEALAQETTPPQQPFNVPNVTLSYANNTIFVDFAIEMSNTDLNEIECLIIELNTLDITGFTIDGVQVITWGYGFIQSQFRFVVTSNTTNQTYLSICAYISKTTLTTIDTSTTNTSTSTISKGIDRNSTTPTFSITSSISSSTTSTTTESSSNDPTSTSTTSTTISEGIDRNSTITTSSTTPSTPDNTTSTSRGSFSNGSTSTSTAISETINRNPTNRTFTITSSTPSATISIDSSSNGPTSTSATLATISEGIYRNPIMTTSSISTDSSSNGPELSNVSCTLNSQCDSNFCDPIALLCSLPPP